MDDKYYYCILNGAMKLSDIVSKNYGSYSSALKAGKSVYKWTDGISLPTLRTFIKYSNLYKYPLQSFFFRGNYKYIAINTFKYNKLLQLYYDRDSNIERTNTLHVCVCEIKKEKRKYVPLHILLKISCENNIRIEELIK